MRKDPIAQKHKGEIALLCCNSPESITDVTQILMKTNATNLASNSARRISSTSLCHCATSTLVYKCLLPRRDKVAGKFLVPPLRIVSSYGAVFCFFLCHALQCHHPHLGVGAVSTGFFIQSPVAFFIKPPVCRIGFY